MARYRKRKTKKRRSMIGRKKKFSKLSRYGTSRGGYRLA